MRAVAADFSMGGYPIVARIATEKDTQKSFLLVLWQSGLSRTP
jgi:hypothetical protein